MKKNIFLLAILCFCWMISAHAETEDLPEIEAGVDSEYEVESEPELIAEADTKTAAPINIDGYVKEAPRTEDPELVQIKQEIQRQKKEAVLNKEKAKGFKELSRSVEVLSETTEEMLEEKRAAKEQIAEYNAKVKCMQQDNPGPECDKYVKRR